jgi:chaperonin GroEL
LKARFQQAECTEENTAYRILIQALQEPIRAILSNAGIPVGETLGKLELAGPGYGFDVLNQQVVDMARVGIYDSVSVAKGVISCAVRGAALALTTQVLVHRRNPPDGSSTT